MTFCFDVGRWDGLAIMRASDYKEKDRMREILFKAKRLDNGEWVEGLLTIMWGEYHIIHKNNENLAYPIIEETICQSTGLTDKNGNKIWENDVVNKVYTNGLGLHIERKCKVSFHKWGYWVLTTEYGDSYWVGVFGSEQLEVIGNIFDNPELLEGGAV